jgi:MFS family permease
LSWVTLAVTTGAILMTAVDGGILPAVLPSIQDEFDLNSAQAGWINTVFFLGLIAGALGFGWLSDRIGTGCRHRPERVHPATARVVDAAEWQCDRAGQGGVAQCERPLVGGADLPAHLR